MKFTKATNYALHTMMYIALVPAGKVIGVKPLADMLQVSPTYLSKILTRLVKAGIIVSTPGVHGGYKLSKSGKEVSFLDVIHAVEGTASLFQCEFEHGEASPLCLIQQEMNEAEKKMEDHLQSKKISDFSEKLGDSMKDLVLREAK
ncbi:Rrf2 family transcriptional regulator [Paenibacillus sp. Marseille-Q4541]|uniref:RrF2 family transcriptional regulator n=1 Tax=Paenibacillus sp. Marseille-Q4541 TaxID=2831522 RepID=UPI001BAB9F7E|nr:Rrf2 family transcriptional regulator [Paenibacillus sp. Marseille-Q4541]